MLVDAVGAACEEYWRVLKSRGKKGKGKEKDAGQAQLLWEQFCGWLEEMADETEDEDLVRARPLESERLSLTSFTFTARFPFRQPRFGSRRSSSFPIPVPRPPPTPPANRSTSVRCPVAREEGDQGLRFGRDAARTAGASLGCANRDVRVAFDLGEGRSIAVDTGDPCSAFQLEAVGPLCRLHGANGGVDRRCREVVRVVDPTSTPHRRRPSRLVRIDLHRTCRPSASRTPSPPLRALPHHHRARLFPAQTPLAPLFRPFPLALLPLFRPRPIRSSTLLRPSLPATDLRANRLSPRSRARRMALVRRGTRPHRTGRQEPGSLEAGKGRCEAQEGRGRVEEV